jgi:hypothetical protein
MKRALIALALVAGATLQVKAESSDKIWARTLAEVGSFPGARKVDGGCWGDRCTVTYAAEAPDVPRLFYRLIVVSDSRGAVEKKICTDDWNKYKFDCVSFHVDEQGIE